MGPNARAEAANAERARREAEEYAQLIRERQAREAMEAAEAESEARSRARVDGLNAFMDGLMNGLSALSNANNSYGVSAGSGSSSARQDCYDDKGGAHCALVRKSRETARGYPAPAR